MVDRTGSVIDGSPASDLLSRKHARLFEILDVDNSGKVTEADIIELGRRLAEAEDGRKSPRALDLSIALTEIWPVGDRSLANGRERLSRDDVVRTLHGYLEHRPDRAIILIGQLASVLFAAFDQDGDEKIDMNEFIQLARRAFSISTAEAEHAWTQIDVLGRGYVDYPQYLTAMTEFMTSINPRSPGNWIFGRL